MTTNAHPLTVAPEGLLPLCADMATDLPQAVRLQRLVDFWSTVALGTRSFKGDVFGKHMALEGVTPAHFAAWVGLWQQHTSRLFAPEVARDLQVAAHGIARNLFRGYFGNDPGFVQPREEQGGHGARPHGGEGAQQG